MLKRAGRIQRTTKDLVHHQTDASALPVEDVSGLGEYAGLLTESGLIWHGRLIPYVLFWRLFVIILMYVTQ